MKELIDLQLFCFKHKISFVLNFNNEISEVLVIDETPLRVIVNVSDIDSEKTRQILKSKLEELLNRFQ